LVNAKCLTLCRLIQNYLLTLVNALIVLWSLTLGEWLAGAQGFWYCKLNDVVSINSLALIGSGSSIDPASNRTSKGQFHNLDKPIWQAQFNRFMQDLGICLSMMKWRITLDLWKQ
jgi:hypothetical protein